jgi:hypothetical protein
MPSPAMCRTLSSTCAGGREEPRLACEAVVLGADECRSGRQFKGAITGSAGQFDTGGKVLVRMLFLLWISGRLSVLLQQRPIKLFHCFVVGRQDGLLVVIHMAYLTHR